MGQYHCGACGCMVIAGVAHVAHDDGCYLPDYSEQEHQQLAVEYAAAYAKVLNPDEPPNSKLPAGSAWVWINGPYEPHWAIRPGRPS